MASQALAHNGKAVEQIKAPIIAMASMRLMQGAYLTLMTSRKSIESLSISYKAKQSLANGGRSTQLMCSRRSNQALIKLSTKMTAIMICELTQ
jgi:hypothetical protein